MKHALVLLICGVLLPATAQQTAANVDIVGIGIGAVGTEYSGPCPVMVHFKATIYLAHAPMTVRYYWERNGGVRTKTQVTNITADSAPKLNVSTDWPVAFQGKSFRATARLHVVTEAGEVVSEEKESTGRCKGR